MFTLGIYCEDNTPNCEFFKTEKEARRRAVDLWFTFPQIDLITLETPEGAEIDLELRSRTAN